MFIHINSVNLKNNYKSRKKKKTKEDLGFIRFTVVYFSMAKKRRATKRNSDVVYLEPVTGQNPFEEPTDENGNPEPRAFTPQIKERVLFYDV